MNYISLKVTSAINRIRNDSNFSLLLKASSFNVMTKIVGTAFGFLASILIARSYGPELYGIVATISSAFTLLSLIALFGNQTLIVKIIPEYIEKHGYPIAKKLYFRILLISLYLTGGIILLWTLSEYLTPITLFRGLEQHSLLIAVLIAIATYKRLNTKTLRALGDYKIYSMFDLLTPVLLALLVLISISLKVPAHYFQYFYFVPQVILCALSFYFVHSVYSQKSKDAFNKKPSPKALPTKASLIKTSFPMFGITISTAIIAHFDILMLNHFTSPGTVGVYAIYAKIVIISSLATQTINSMFAPTVSRLFSANKFDELKIFAKKTTFLSFSVSITLTAIFLLIHKPFLGLYGDDFLTELPTLYTLLFSSVVISFFGPVGFYLNMTGHQASFFKIILLAACMNIVLNILLIPTWGAFGAAFATLLCVLTWNILATLKTLKEFKHTIVWTGGFYA